MKFRECKLISLVVSGNILDYYDFLLFAHLGPVITALFLPNLSPKEAHLFGLLLFALPFVVRPIGGYIFGRLSDRQGRQYALSKTAKYASIASLGIALLPSYAYGGLVCSILFLFLRAMQGLSLGGEYTTAGTFLMERYTNKQGLISGILCASGTIGSLLAFFFAWLYINHHIVGDSWRIAFILGGVGAYISVLLRKKLGSALAQHTPAKEFRQHSAISSLYLTFLIGALVGVLCWLPMVYTNFYFTKVLHLSSSFGLQATLLALTSYVILNPIFGAVADRYSAKFIMTIGALLALPLGVVGYILIKEGLLVGQIFLITGASMFGAPIHVVMNQLFPPKNRSTNINTSFMLGTSVGGLTPFISGYFSDHYQFQDFPFVVLAALSLLAFVSLYQRFYRRRTLAGLLV